MSPDFPWTNRSTLAARLVSEDDLTDVQIATRVGINRRTLTRWRDHPAFAARVAEHVDAWKTRIRNQGIAIRERRLKALNDRELLMLRVIAERAAADEFVNVPGGTTGLLVHTYKAIGTGEYAVDTGLLAELRAHEKQAAQELGQWVEKGEIRGSREAPLVFEHVSPEQVERAERAFLAALGLEPGPVGDHASDDHPPDAGTDTVPPV